MYTKYLFLLFLKQTQLLLEGPLSNYANGDKRDKEVS